MHNSLYIRDLLSRMNNDELRRDRRNPHRLVDADPTAVALDDEIALTGTWRIDSDALEAFQAAGDDLGEFFGLMGIQSSGDARNIVELRQDSSLPPRAYRLSVEPTHIGLYASDAAGIWAGTTWIEREMRVRRGPFIPTGNQEHTARWRWQVSQGPWGGNYSVPDFSPEYLSDDAFRLYAHYGVNSMMIYGDILCYARSKALPELNHPEYDHHIEMLRDAAVRAAKYGVQFTYVVVGPKLRADHPVFQAHPTALGSGSKSREGDYNMHCLCSSDEKVLGFYEEVYTQLFEAVPQLAGMYFIIATESFYHCRMWQQPAHECPQCFGQVQEDVVANMLGRFADAVQAVKPDAFVLGWPYNSEPWDRPDALEFVRRLPKNVGLFSQIDRLHLYNKGDYRKLVWDYSVDFTGPSAQILDKARIAKERGLTFFTKTETGIGLEVFQFPYVPSLNRLADKWQVMRDLEPDGVHQSWLFFGMFGSRAEELALWAAYSEDSRDTFLEEMARRDFGPEAVDHALAAWTEMSVAVGHIPCVTLTSYYVGPSFLGPCHPLIPSAETVVPDAFSAVLFYLQEGEETFSRRQTEVRSSLVMDQLADSAASVAIEWDGPGDGWDIVLREYRKAALHAKISWEYLQSAADNVWTQNDSVRLSEESALAELVYRTFLTCASTVEFLHERRKLEEDPKDNQADARMREIAREELANTEAAVPIYEACPWLDLAERTDGFYTRCVDMLAAKRRMLIDYLGDS
jgi:hypothetical protein